jgi:hypothetical protein
MPEGALNFQFNAARVRDRAPIPSQLKHLTRL